MQLGLVVVGLYAFQKRNIVLCISYDMEHVVENNNQILRY